MIRENEERLKEIGEYRVRLVYSAHLKLDSLQNLNEEVNKVCYSLEEEFGLLNHDISTVSKYVGIIYKFKINRQARLYEKMETNQ